ncbi:hypothetical protein FIBSPDRAFT_847117 [Athelia psychrophila]|uniref:Uncharacterized protein n=1 Tax=Athelia psychrophila TaxID=1759441 RepID=A0A166WQ33_9AGAM|nr:hypothetical protein FIBSPDRAFT_847117 [Fibularhizoctonia sp. CBS 109695]
MAELKHLVQPQYSQEPHAPLECMTTLTPDLTPLLFIRFFANAHVSVHVAITALGKLTGWFTMYPEKC